MTAAHRIFHDRDTILEAPFHCLVSRVSKSPRQMTSADTVVADTMRNARNKPLVGRTT
jgi:hypothetical protein